MILTLVARKPILVSGSFPQEMGSRIWRNIRRAAPLALLALAVSGCAVTPPQTFAERMAEMQAQVKMLQAMREPTIPPNLPVLTASEDKEILQRILRLLDDLFGRVERLEAK